jgi:predicted RNA methylase
MRSPDRKTRFEIAEVGNVVSHLSVGGYDTVPNAIVDLFCGIGGLTHGLELAGLNVVAGIDIETSCRYAIEGTKKVLLTIKCGEIEKLK